MFSYLFLNHTYALILMQGSFECSSLTVLYSHLEPYSLDSLKGNEHMEMTTLTSDINCHMDRLLCGLMN